MPFSICADLKLLETELQKRFIYPYVWLRKQNDAWDVSTQFIYDVFNFDTLITQIKIHYNNLKTDTSFVEYFNYALNRWYNFWSARAVEQMFTESPKVQIHKNRYDKYIDFWLENLPFDHKTTVFPKGFKKDFNEALKCKKELALWLYKNQSREGRRHFKNRLFVVLYSTEGAHWQLKANLDLINSCVKKYIQNFHAEQLISLSFKSEKKATLTDIIFVTK